MVLLGIRWYLVSKGLVCLNILEKVEIWSGVTDASHTDRQTTEDRSTQLLYSIQFKLSHAIIYAKKDKMQSLVKETVGTTRILIRYQKSKKIIQVQKIQRLH